MDGGGEFLNNRLQRFVDKHGITLKLSTPYKPSENGKAERMNRLIQDTMRTLMTTAGISKGFWSFASIYSSAIWNTLLRKNKKHSPYYQLFQRHPPYNASEFLVLRDLLGNLRN